MTAVAVTGGRKYTNRSRAYQVLDAAVERHGLTVLIEGGASGLDQIAEDWAIDRNVEYRRVEAAWSDLSHPDAIIRARPDGTKYDAKAGGRRNQRMIDEFCPIVLLAFEGKSGTRDMIRRARDAGLIVHLIDWGGQ